MTRHPSTAVGQQCMRTLDSGPSSAPLTRKPPAGQLPRPLTRKRSPTTLSSIPTYQKPPTIAPGASSRVFAPRRPSAAPRSIKNKGQAPGSPPPPQKVFHVEHSPPPRHHHHPIRTPRQGNRRLHREPLLLHPSLRRR